MPTCAPLFIFVATAISILLYTAGFYARRVPKTTPPTYPSAAGAWLGGRLPAATPPPTYAPPHTSPIAKPDGCVGPTCPSVLVVHTTVARFDERTALSPLFLFSLRFAFPRYLPHPPTLLRITHPPPSLARAVAAVYPACKQTPLPLQQVAPVSTAVTGWPAPLPFWTCCS